MIQVFFIFFIWFITYLIFTFTFEQRLGWDEVSYLACARGIAEDFDFSSRFNTVMGIIKYPFPQHTHHYPLYSIYLAIFFKLFGTSLHVAYFSTWLAALVTCLFIYMTMLLLTDANKPFSFTVGISFLFLPRILNFCDSAMMEIPGCALLSIFTYFIFKDVSNGKLNPILVGIASIFLFFFKSLYFGAIAGFILLIVLTYKFKSISQKRKALFKSIGLFAITFTSLYLIFAKFVFLPLAPMMSFHKKQEVLDTYADFLGGFFKDPIGNLAFNISGFFENVFFHYFPSFPVLLISGEEGFYGFGPSWCDFGLFVLVLFYVVVFLFFLWNKLSKTNRLFIVFTLVSILVMNIVFTLLTNNNIGNRCRYNMIYLPLLLISAASLVSPKIISYTQRKIFVIASFIVLVYIPFFIGEIKTEEWTKKTYHEFAHAKSEVVKKYVGDSKPTFIYFNTGTHTSWDLFPTRVILQEANNSQLKLLNLKLPKPIEFLFLQPTSRLIFENQDLISKGLPILDDWYTFLGVDNENKVIVYKLKS